MSADPAVTPAVVERAAHFLRAAADGPRLTLLIQLAHGERCVTDLAAEGERLSTVSQRLKVLREAGLVTRRRDGKRMLYRVADDHVRELVRSVLEHALEDL